LRVGAGVGDPPLRRTVAPDHTGRKALRRRNLCPIRRVEGTAQLRNATNRTEAVIGEVVSAPIVRLRCAGMTDTDFS